MPSARFSRSLATPTASVGASASRSASASPAASIASSGWTALISPSAAASRAGSRGLSSTSSIALWKPTSRGRKNVELSAPVSPVFRYAHSNHARSDAITRSHASARPRPPAAAGPSTTANHGLGERRISEIVEWMYSRICLNTAP